MADWFLERREVRDSVHVRSGLRLQAPLTEKGWASCRSLAGGVEWRWADLPGDKVPPGELPSEVAARGESLLAPVPLRSAPDEAVEAALLHLVETARAAGASHLEILLREVDRGALFHGHDRQTEDRQRHALLELKAFHTEGGTSVDAWRCSAFPDTDQLLADLPALSARVEAMVRALQESAPVQPCPTGALPIVFPPGAASACFFHEVCGHPLEGDVVARGGSYLAHRRGQRVAGEHVSVSDDPTDAHGALTFAWDDEGHAARLVPLLRGGIVGTPLVDTRSAAVLGLACNGHGRRVSYRHPPLARMGHTRVEPHQGRLETLMADVPHGLLVQHLTPRHMNLLSGDFSFYVVEAREIRDGHLGRRVSPGILRGNGLEALAAIDAVGEDVSNLFATRGCRKLDHGPLPVSFGQPSIRFRQLYVEPWR
ncbi:TldD/PmbA family protein [Myxococcus xanthus]|uniref:TldD/PmbA family protein n=1 Tax=Myxococcus xanthus TaxID=34 RepID=UPI0011295735|nr:metallopeptidase TldD-related protein [Myxococcus xanthus]QDE81494.1 TldD/PmbA family protein [Myxococcus xanthus]